MEEENIIESIKYRTGYPEPIKYPIGRYPISQIESKKRHIIGSSKVSRRIRLESDDEKENILKARTLVRSVIHRYIITGDYRWAKRTIDGHCARNKEQIYKWTNSGHQKAYAWLESNGVEEPETSPLERNVELLNKGVTAMWLMHNLNGKRLHKTLRKHEFTIPLIAFELARLKY